MPKKSHLENTVGPWAEVKLTALENYLRQYLRVLQNQAWCNRRVYIDAFAGAGISRLRQVERPDNDPDATDLFGPKHETLDAAEQYVKGSPLRALALPFDDYHFIDADNSRLDILNSHVRALQRPNRTVTIKQGDANQYLQALARGWPPKSRGVAFLDPYGPQLAWATVASLAEAKHIEVIINLPIQMSLIRLCDKEESNLKLQHAELMDKVYGDRSWHEAVWLISGDLLGDRRKRVKDAVGALLECYVTKLQLVFKHVSTPQVVTNTTGREIYYLLWAGNHDKGCEIAEHILTMGKKLKKPNPQGDLF